MERELVARLGSPISRPTGPLPRLGGKPAHEHGRTALTSRREAIHHGHRIVIMTTYSITIDDEPLEAHVEVDALGRVHYHGLPNYNFASAVDMVKTIIDSEPATFSDHPEQRADRHDVEDHGGEH